MKIQVEKVSNLGRKLNVEVPSSLVGSTFEKFMKGIQQQANIKGFRKGKAPLQTIKSMYGDRLKQDVVQELLQAGYAKALQEHNLEPISYPNFEFDDITEGKDFSFSAAFEVRPEVKISKYEGLEVLKEKYVIDDSRVEAALQNIRSSRATQELVTENRAAVNGDIAVIDFEGIIDGKPLENGSGTDHPLELGTNQFIEGFEEGVVGMKTGDTKTLSLKFPDPYQAAELAGKAVQFKVTLKALKTKVLPELTEEFLKTLGVNSGLEELKNSIKADMEQSEQKRINDEFKNRLLKELVKNNPVDVPNSLLVEQKNALIKDFENRMQQQGMSPADFDQYRTKWDADFESTAKQMIQSGFLIDTLAEKHDLKWKKEDLEQKFEEFAAQTGIEIARIKEFYNRPESMNRLTYQITEEKVLDLLIKSAKIKEVNKEEIKETNN